MFTRVKNPAREAFQTRPLRAVWRRCHACGEDDISVISTSESISTAHLLCLFLTEVGWECRSVRSATRLSGRSRGPVNLPDGQPRFGTPTRRRPLPADAHGGLRASRVSLFRSAG